MNKSSNSCELLFRLSKPDVYYISLFSLAAEVQHATRKESIPLPKWLYIITLNILELKPLLYKQKMGLFRVYHLGTLLIRLETIG